MGTDAEQFAEWRHYLEKHGPAVEAAVLENLPAAPAGAVGEFEGLLRQAVGRGDGRILPFLTLLASEQAGGDPAEALPASAAVEYVHAASRVFGDLPGFSTGEARSHGPADGPAILVGLSLLNAAYPLVFTNHSGMPERALAAHAEIVECVGGTGLVGGLAPSAGTDAANAETERLRFTALIRLAVRLGGILAGANYLELAGLTRFAELLGEAYFLRRGPDGGGSGLELNAAAAESQAVLVDNFPSNEARTCLIQLAESLASGK